MRLTHSLVFTSLLTIAAIAAPLRPAEACSAPLCNGGHFIPEAASAPASIAAIVWAPSVGQGTPTDPSGVGLFLVQGGMEQPVPVMTTLDPGTTRYLVHPVNPLLADADYVVRGADYCAGSGKIDNTASHTALHTTASAPLPAALGQAVVASPTEGNLDVWTDSGSCTSPITAAQASVDLTLSADAAPWAAAFEYAILVDNKPWSSPRPLNVEPPLGGSVHGVVYTSCASSDPGADKGLSQGMHSIIFRASLPGTAVTLETKPVTVTLICQNGGSSSSSSSSGGGGGGGGGGGPNPPADPGGCSVGAGARGVEGRLGWLLAVAIGGVMARIRRAPAGCARRPRS